ncbi:AGAP007442-PA-like protein [Anopheles sinensis]|uniref:AGAP007442-PA-like protein n=1 Tax=Anopheles sinensis TaxID=74873 RepID=A0A084WN73_ANOSI|nr:AGAP007442-PA-like protein [Anopheles sinensis]
MVEANHNCGTIWFVVGTCTKPKLHSVVSTEPKEPFHYFLLLANVWLWSLASSVGNARPKPCVQDMDICTYDKLNFSADGLQRIRASATIMQNAFTVQVDQLITPYPDGVLLLLFDEFVNTVQYRKFHDRFFRIPAGCKLSEISVGNAPQMQLLLVAAPNDHLLTLELLTTGMVRLPDSLLHLRAIRTLIVHDCLLETFSLDPLANSSNITVLMLGLNRVKQLIVSDNPDLVLPVTDFSLADNQLEFIDGAFFNPLKHLVQLDLAENRIQRIDGPGISFPRLKICLLYGNQITHFNTSNWRAPQLLELFMSSNNLTQIPVGLESLPNLTKLELAYNKLSTIDLRRLEGCRKLQTIDFSSNLLQTVRVSQQGQVTLPQLKTLNLGQNQISQIDFTRWNMPALTFLTMYFNRLERLPDLFKFFPKLQQAVANRNPLRCNSLRQLQSYLAENKLIVDSNAYGQTCRTNSSFKVSTGAVICCVG